MISIHTMRDKLCWCLFVTLPSRTLYNLIEIIMRLLIFVLIMLLLFSCKKEAVIINENVESKVR